MTAFCFALEAQDVATKARAGRLTTPRGDIETPVFMPVGTRATVKGLLPAQLQSIGVPIILGNTYHLALRPGAERVRQLGGLHRFMGWDRPILTDSGGFQIFSLQSLRHLDDDAVEFRSHLDGQILRLTPERAIAIQNDLGADIIMCLDECPPATADRDHLAVAVARTTRWARRCQSAHARSDQALFGIVQGGIDPDLRAQSARELVELGFPGYAVGGLSVGESQTQMLGVLDSVVDCLPHDRPRYLMGVGTPTDLVEAVARGIDMFDCVMPTRNGRNATAFTSVGIVKMRNQIHADDSRPLDPQCDCPACTQFSRAYLRHLFQVEEMLGPILLSLHNIAFYCRLMRDLRASIQAGTFADRRRSLLATFAAPSAPGDELQNLPGISD